MILDYNGSVDQMDVVKLCYDYAYLMGIQKMGLKHTPTQIECFESLSRLLKGDADAKQRQHRRLPVLTKCSIKTSNNSVWGTLLNISANGMFLVTKIAIEKGSIIQVSLGCPGEVKYIFTCKVIRQTRNGNVNGVGLAFHGVPLEIRQGFASEEPLLACA